MKLPFIISIFILAISSALANERYTDNVYTGATFVYWCTYKKVPASKVDIAKIKNGHLLDTDIDTALELDFDIWLDSVSYKINGDNLTLIKKSKVVASDKFQIILSSESNSNCISLEKQ